MEPSASYYEFVGFQSPATQPAEDLADLVIEPQRTAFLTDFDGTLVDIAPTPDAINFTAADGRLLNRASSSFGGAVAVISGRNLADVARYLGAFSGIVSGGHGVELRIDGEIHELATPDPERLEHIKAAVTEYAIIDPRVILEDKSHGIVMHFRQNPEMEARVRAFAECLLEGCGEFELQPAKMAYEIKPKGISKASAIERILETAGFEDRVPLYAGDDKTDETAFRHINELGGITIKIGDGATVARFRTESPATFKAWLGTQISKRRI